MRSLLLLALVAAVGLAAKTPRLHSTRVHEEGPGGLRHHLEVDGELGEATLVLSDFSGLKSTRCVDGGDVDDVHLSFATSVQCSQALKELAVGSVFISGHNKALKCRDYTHHHQAASMIDRVVSQPVCKGRMLSLKTERAELHHVFKEARIRLVTNSFLNSTRQRELAVAPGSSSVVDFSSAAVVTRQGEKLDSQLDESCIFCWITNAYNSIVSSISGIADTMEEAVESVWRGIESLPSVVGGNFAFNHDWQLATVTKNFSLGFATGSGYAQVNCTACGFSLGVDLVVEAQITSYTLSSLQAFINGSAEVVADVLFQTGTFSFNSLNNEIRLPTITLPPIEFAVGPLPVVINTAIPLAAGWSLSAEAHAQVATSARLGGKVAFGIQYTKANGWGYIHSLSFEQRGKVDSIAVAGHGTGSVFFMPVMTVQVDYIGGPSLALRASSDASVFFDLSNACPTTHATASANIGLDSTVSANISISALGKQIINWSSPAATVFSKHFPLFSGCISVPKNAVVDVSSSLELDSSTSAGSQEQGDGFPGFLVLGATWAGNQTRVGDPTTCATVPAFLDIFAQAIPDNNGNPELVLTYSGDWPGGGYCVSQLLYSSTALTNGAITLTPQTSAPVNFDQCAGGSPSSHRFSATTLQVSSDYRILSAQRACFLFQLERRFSGE